MIMHAACRSGFTVLPVQQTGANRDADWPTNEVALLLFPHQVQHTLEFRPIPDAVQVRFGLQVHFVAVAGIDGLFESLEGFGDVPVVGFSVHRDGHHNRTDGVAVCDVHESGGIIRQFGSHGFFGQLDSLAVVSDFIASDIIKFR